MAYLRQQTLRNLTDVHARVHCGAYRAQPSPRTYIPKADGKQRPLAVAALEDKIVQRATETVLNRIYEEEFLGFSYGFRPERRHRRSRRDCSAFLKAAHRQAFETPERLSLSLIGWTSIQGGSDGFARQEDRHSGVSMRALPIR